MGKANFAESSSATRKHHTTDDKIRIVLEGLRGEEIVAAICAADNLAPFVSGRAAFSFCQAAPRFRVSA